LWFNALQAFLNFMWDYSSNGTGLLEPKGIPFLGDWQSPHGCGSSADALLHGAHFVCGCKL
jgi:hypothetical protein